MLITIVYFVTANVECYNKFTSGNQEKIISSMSAASLHAIISHGYATDIAK